MERRYLAATIAMAATFAVFSHAFSAGLLTKMQQPKATLISEMHCAAQSLRTRLLDKVNRSLGSGTAEEAQLRVELNLPSPAFVAAAPAVPAPPARPRAMAAKSLSVPAVACPSQRLVADRVSRDFERAQARAMALQSRALAEQAKIQSKALATQARIMAVQVRLNSQAMQREITRAALAQARASMTQAKINSHSCSGEQAVRVSSRSGDDDFDVNVDVDQISRQIEDQVTRRIRNSVPNF
jgi:hypothetical protein